MCALVAIWADFHFQNVNQYGHERQVVLYFLTGPWLLARAAATFLVPVALPARGLAADIASGLFLGHLIVAVLRLDQGARLLSMLPKEPLWRNLIPVAALLVFAVVCHLGRNGQRFSPARVGVAAFSVLILSVGPIFVTAFVVLLGGGRR